ncbi:hypothetical protein GGI12_000986 [Dipsacomyces acuminosporus]|nr:hypothetical protein GGI12_000986 [Dipsacomyces acuminosporus]
MNVDALHYPLDRLHYLLFQLVFFIMLPSIITAAGDTDFAHKLEVARKSGSRASSRQRSPSPHAGDVADQHKPHVHSEQCRKLESEFLRLAGQDSTAPDSPWTPLVSQTSPYPITVQGHKSKPFCFRITFYAPTLPGTAFDLLADILRRPDWDELMETTRIIEKLSPADNIHYVKMKPVWPTASRDSVMISHIASVPLNGTEKAAEAGDAKAVEYGYLNASQSIEDDRLPERTDEGIVRMVAGIAGQLVMMAPEEDKQRLGLEGANWCKVTQIADGDLKGWIPKSVIKFVATQALPRSITKVSKQLASMEHSMESQFIRNLSLPSAKVYTTAATSSSSPSPSSSPSRSSTNPASRTRKGNDGSALFYLDESSIPIRLVPASTTSNRRQWHQQQQQAARMATRSPSPPVSQEHAIPGYSYIRLAGDSDFEGTYPFDAFQDLRSAYGTSTLSNLQARMNRIQEQRARAQLQRALLEQQLQEQARREKELREYQYRLELQRREQAGIAAQRARAAYLDRLEEQERARQLEMQKAAAKAEKDERAKRAATQAAAQALEQQKQEDSEQDGVFYPPFHFFNHILDSQIKSRDELERKRAQKSALENLLNTYFGFDRSAFPAADSQEKENEGQTVQSASTTARDSSGKAHNTTSSKSHSPTIVVPAAAAAAAAATPSDDARSVQVYKLSGPRVDDNVLDNVLRVVHRKLGEIAAEEDTEANEPVDNHGVSNEGNNNNHGDVKVNVDVITEPAHDKASKIDRDISAGDQKGVEIEEPVDYRKLAENLRARVSKLDDDDIILPISPLLSASDDDGLEPPTQQPRNAAKAPDSPEPSKTSKAADTTNESSDVEFSHLLNKCKRQLSDLQEASIKPECEAAHRLRRNRSRRRRHNRRVQQQRSSSKPSAALEASAPAETDEERQKRAVHTIEAFILGLKSKRNAVSVVESLRALKSIEQDLDKVRNDYNRRLRNTQLSFVADKEGNLRLAHNRANFTFHEYQEVLQRLLFKLDEVPSYSDETVRYKRKSIVRKIQNTLDALDQFAFEQESELSESSAYDGTLGDESSNADWY